MNIIKRILFLILGAPICYGLELVTLTGQLERLALPNQRAVISSVEKLPRQEVYPEIVDDIFIALVYHFVDLFFSEYIDDNFSFVIKKEKEREGLDWSIKRSGKYGALQENDNDVFCQINKGKASARLLYADDKYIGIFSKDNPLSTVNTTKILVIPRKHIHSIMRMSADELGELIQRSMAIAARLGSHEYVLQINRGSPLQQVPHVHLHLTMQHKPPLKKPIIELLNYENWHGVYRTAYRVDLGTGVDGSVVIEDYPLS